MLVIDIPSPEKVKLQGWNKNKPYYVVHNFKTHMIYNVNLAINYYYQKYKMFITLANTQFAAKLGILATVPSLETMFNQAFNEYNSSVAPAWENIQNMKTTQLQSRLKAFNSETQLLEAGAENLINFGQLLQYLNNNEIINSNIKTLPNTINLTHLQSVMSNFLSLSSGQQAGGQRSIIFGEIFEQGANGIINSNIDGLLNYFQVGSKNSLLPNGKIGYGKTDGLLTLDSISIIDQKVGKNTITVTNQNIPLEASELFDLSQGGYLSALGKYIENPAAGGILGITNKAWTGNRGTFGSFSASASEIVSRTSQGISEWFAESEEFHLYSSYVVSKYLINIIGAHNAIIASGSHMGPTYQWLANLYNNSNTIRHADNLKSSIGSRSGEEWGRKYIVRNNLIIARSI